MSTATELFCQTKAMDAMIGELDVLESRYSELLEQEGLTEDVSLLKTKMEGCLGGSREASDYLNEHGNTILADIKNRLKAVVAEQARIIEESPNHTHTTGRKVHEASRAAALLTDAD